MYNCQMCLSQSAQGCQYCNPTYQGGQGQGLKNVPSWQMQGLDPSYSPFAEIKSQLSRIEGQLAFVLSKLAKIEGAE